MNVFAFQTVTAVVLATASFRHLRADFCRRASKRFLSDSFDFVMVRAVFKVLLIHNFAGELTEQHFFPLLLDLVNCKKSKQSIPTRSSSSVKSKIFKWNLFGIPICSLFFV